MLSGCQNPRHVFFTSTHFWHLWGCPSLHDSGRLTLFIISYCIYSYLIDHIKPYIRIYTHHIYLQSISCMIIQKHHPTSSNMYHPTSDFTIPSILPKGFFETTAVLHTGAAAGSAPTTSPDTATAAALIGGAGQCSTAWDAEDLTGCAKKVQFNFQDCRWSYIDSSRFHVLVTVRNVDEDLMMRRLDSKSLWTCPSRSFSWSQLKILEFLWFAVCHVWRVLKQDMLEIERVGYWWYWVLDLALFQR